MLLQRDRDFVPVGPEAVPETEGASCEAGHDVETAAPGGRYGERRGPNYPALAAALGAQALILPALLSLGAHALSHREPAHVVALNLSSSPPPGPKEPKPKADPEPRKLAMAATPQPRPVLNPTPVPRIVLSDVPAPIAPVVQLNAPVPPAPVTTSAARSEASQATGEGAGQSGPASADLNAIHMLSGDPPSYPYESRRKKEQGTVRLRLLLGPDGRVETLSVASSSGFPRLDKAALEAVRRWRWTPTLRNGKAVEILGFLEIPFVLRHS